MPLRTSVPRVFSNYLTNHLGFESIEMFIQCMKREINLVDQMMGKMTFCGVNFAYFSDDENISDGWNRGPKNSKTIVLLINSLCSLIAKKIIHINPKCLNF